MSESNEFILSRALATRSAQASISATWLWPDKTLAEWDADIAAFEAANEEATDAEADKDGATGDWDSALNTMHLETQLGINLLRNKFRNDPAKIHMLKSLKARGESRTAIMREALDWESAWESAAPTWTYEAGKTLAAFKLLRESCLALSKTVSNEKSDWREKVGQWNELGAVLNENCVAWYSAATRLFKEGTPQGDMIRGTIPTTYNPNGLPSKAVITTAQPTLQQGFHLEFTAAGATSYDLLQKIPGSATFIKTAENITEGSITVHNQTPGSNEFKVYGKNAKGDGPESAVVTIVIQP